MKLIAILISILSAIALVNPANAEEKLRYFIVEGALSPAVAKSLVDNPGDVMEAARKTFEVIAGGKLVDYYLFLGSPKNLAIIALPDSDYAAAITYQRFGTGALNDIEVYEVIPGSRFEEILKLSKELN